MLDDGGVMLIEWGDAICPVLPADYLEVRITFGDDGPTTTGSSSSEPSVVARGRPGPARCAEALAPWIDGRAGRGGQPC